DALGHGPIAAKAAAVAISSLERHPLDRGLQRLVETVHEDLRGTRGAAATICLLENGKLEGCGVGNVEMRCPGNKLPVQLNPGVLGLRARQLKVFQGTLRPGDKIFIFSDGISAQVRLDPLSDMSPRQACEEIIMKHRKPHDDATVLVAELED